MGALLHDRLGWDRVVTVIGRVDQKKRPVDGSGGTTDRVDTDFVGKEGSFLSVLQILGQSIKTVAEIRIP